MAYCRMCDRYFVHRGALNQHYENSWRHDYCVICEQEFDNAKALSEHRSRCHECGRCHEAFDDPQELSAHIEERHWHCGTCYTFFDSEQDLVVHYLQSSGHRCCDICSRNFMNENNFKTVCGAHNHTKEKVKLIPQQHMRSNRHAIQNVKCPGCSRMFGSISGMTIHLESGTCQSGINRLNLNAFVRSKDTNHIITNRLLTNGDSTNSGTKTFATGAAWNGSSYECYFCNRTYRTLRALNQHLGSPAHEQPLYHCPNCACQFKLLSGIIQHVESESCGIAKFAQVKRTFDTFTAGIRSIGYC